jgi:nucleotide-binding universal stress UspA family protein
MKILVGYDGSNAAMDALKLAAKHAKAFNAQVEVATSLPGGDNSDVDLIAEAEKKLAFTKSYLEKEGVPCETHLLIRGMPPGEDIVKFAGENKAYEIVIGIKRRSKVGKLLFGSNAQYVILNAPCPVVTIR